MSERLKQGSQEETLFVEGGENSNETELATEYADGVLATPDQADLLRAAIVRAGQNPEKVGASAFIKFSEQVGEDGVVTQVPTVTGVWIKSGTPNGKEARGTADEQLEELATTITPPSPKVYSVRTSAKKTAKKDKIAGVLSDVQFGYRRILVAGKEILVPVHDPQALNVGRQVIKHAQPDLVLDVGDALDFASFSHFSDDSRGTGLMRPTLQGFQRDVTAGIRADNPNARYVWLEGNHEKRWFKQIYDRFPELGEVYNIGAGGELGRLALSLQSILHLDELEIEYLEGYPANRFKINDRLTAMHGDSTKGKGNTANHYLHRGDMPTKSFIFGHTHRNESASTRVRVDDDTWITREAHSFGALCKVDGTVPGTTSGRTLDGSNVESTPNWQQGVGIIEYQEGDRPFYVHHVPIHTEDGYEARFDGRTFYPTCDEFGQPL